MRKPMTVGKAMRKYNTFDRYWSPVGMHVMMECWDRGEVRTLLGTVKAVVRDDSVVEGYSQVLVVHYFNGEPWDFRPHPSEVYIIER
jgi:hypothetical protein